jgi:hypothetical protein
MNRYHLALLLLIVVIAVLLFALPAHAAAAPSFSVADVRVAENGGSAAVTITKNAKAKSYSRITVTTADGTAKSGNDYAPISVSLTFGNNELAKTVQVPIVDDKVVEPEESFAVRIAAARFATIARGSAAITIADDDASTPPPAAVEGEAAIADNFNTNAALEPSAIPDQSNEPRGAFRMSCNPGQLLHDDPLLFPNQPGASHLHQFWGNTGTNAFSTYQSLRTTGDTTCGAAGAPVNRTAYWMPAMLDGAGHAVKPDSIQIYYKQTPLGSAGCRLPVAITCVGLPNGIKLVFGYNMKTGLGGTLGSDYYHMHYECWTDDLGTPALNGGFTTISGLVQAGCKAGNRLAIIFAVPACWDGKNLGSPDMRAHMSYGTEETGGQYCPADHPYAISAWQGTVRFTTDDNFAKGLWHLSSDEMVPGAPAGSTLHFDYFEAWSPAIKAKWQANCIDGHLTCADGQLGDGTHIKTITPQPFHQLVPIP